MNKTLYEDAQVRIASVSDTLAAISIRRRIGDGVIWLAGGTVFFGVALMPLLLILAELIKSQQEQVPLTAILFDLTTLTLLIASALAIIVSIPFFRLGVLDCLGNEILIDFANGTCRRSRPGILRKNVRLNEIKTVEIVRHDRRHSVTFYLTLSSEKRHLLYLNYWHIWSWSLLASLTPPDDRDVLVTLESLTTMLSTVLNCPVRYKPSPWFKLISYPH